MLGAAMEAALSFDLTESHLRSLMAKCGFCLPDKDMIFVGIRGCIPLDSNGSEFADKHKLQFIGTDNVHFRCTLLQWKIGGGFAVFPGSTVPHVNAIKAGLPRGGAGVNQLALGFYRDGHSYHKGDHKAGTPRSRHRAFRNDSVLPVWRTHDDLDFEGDDDLDVSVVPGDNIHCAWQQNAAAATFSSNGCQVIVGRPRVLARDWNEELGAWAGFVKNAYDLAQARFAYALFSGREVLSIVEGSSKSPTVRFGTSGDLAEIVQDALIKHGFGLGPAGADGDFGLASVTALRQFQKQTFGAGGVDLIVGKQTATALGIADWPSDETALPARIGLVAQPIGPSDPAGIGAAGKASAGPIAEALDTGPAFRTLTPDGVFSDNPFDMSKRRAFRTNNPGALNITAWQCKFQGFAGVTQPDHQGNKTTIYFTPEHGVAAWHHLLTHIYGFGDDGELTITDLAQRYAGIKDGNHPAVRSYLAGWKKAAGPALTDGNVLQLADDEDMQLLAKGMFAHELGGPSPLKPAQIVNALTLKRAGRLPQS